MSQALNILAFEQARREAAIWCERAGPNSQFRTAALRPSLSDWPSSEELGLAVEALIKERRKLLGALASIELPQGRVLICEINLSISSGESEAETSGFFDGRDRPAWDTWIWTVPSTTDSGEATLLSWVPNSLAALVNRGIEVNPYECIFWLSDAPSVLAETPTVQALLAAGIR
jgi:hypothetical protein